MVGRIMLQKNLLIRTDEQIDVSIVFPEKWKPDLKDI
jgi:hypothetical protein